MPGLSACPVVIIGAGPAGLTAAHELSKQGVPSTVEEKGSLMGRNGMHRCNNQDHSMLTAVLAARNIVGARYDLWQVNVDTDYLEEGAAITEETLKAMEGKS